MLELPARHLLNYLDNGTDSPSTTNGPIGRAIKHLNKNLNPFVAFEQINSNIPDIPRELFERHEDLIILYDLVKGIGKPNF